MCTDYNWDSSHWFEKIFWLMLYGAVLAGACCVLVGGTMMIQCIKQRRQQRKPLLLPVVAATPVMTQTSGAWMGAGGVGVVAGEVRHAH